MKRIISILLALGPCGLAFAGSDSCEDLSFRLYRADLAPYALKIQEVQSDEFGNYQNAELTLKNVGTVRLGPLQAPGGGFNVAPIRVRFGQFTADSWVSLPVAPEATTKAHFRLPEGFISNCQSLEVRIDTVKGVGQHGCDCYRNDKKTFAKVHIVGEPSCRIPLP